MEKLAQKQTYIKRCGYCHLETSYLARDSNVNASLIDNDIYNSALRNVGESEVGRCEACNFLTLQTVVAYRFEQESAQSQEEKKCTCDCHRHFPQDEHCSLC